MYTLVAVSKLVNVSKSSMNTNIIIQLINVLNGTYR